jgi:TM2 domain-containing membrane protein YozV
MSNGNGKTAWLWRGIIVGVITLIMGLMTWNFTEVAAIPKAYPTKVEVDKDNAKQDTRIERLSRDIQEGFRETQRIILDLHK